MELPSYPELLSHCCGLHLPPSHRLPCLLLRVGMGTPVPPWVLTSSVNLPSCLSTTTHSFFLSHSISHLLPAFPSCPLICLLPSALLPLCCLYWLSSHIISLPVTASYVSVSPPWPHVPSVFQSCSISSPVLSSFPYLPASSWWGSLSSFLSICIFLVCLLPPTPSSPPPFPTSSFFRPPTLKDVWETFVHLQRPLWLYLQPAPLLQSRIHLVSHAPVWPCRRTSKGSRDKRCILTALFSRLYLGVPR